MDIEKDIKILNKFIDILKDKSYKENAQGWHGYFDDELIAVAKAIKNVLAENENLSQAIEVNKRLYEDKCNELKVALEENTRIMHFHYDPLISIPRQKIQDELENTQLLYEENLKAVILKEVEQIERNIFEGIRLESRREVLQELLQNNQK